MLLASLLLGACATPAPTPSVVPAGDWNLDYEAGSLAYRQGRYYHSEVLHRSALGQAGAFPPHDRRRALSLNDLGLVLSTERRFQEAEDFFKRAVSEWEGIGDAAGTATSLNNLGELYRARRDWNAAEIFHRRALALREGLKGRQRWHSAISLNNLGQLAENRGRDADAESLYRSALAAFIPDTSVDELQMATVLSNIAAIYLRQGRRGLEASSLSFQSLTIRARHMSTGHPALATNVRVVEQGHRAAAKELEARGVPATTAVRLLQLTRASSEIWLDLPGAMMIVNNNVSQLCYRYTLLGSWKATSRPALYSSQEGRVLAGVQFFRDADLRQLGDGAQELLPLGVRRVTREYERALGMPSSHVEVARFTSTRIGALKWTAPPLERGDGPRVGGTVILWPLHSELLAQVTVLAPSGEDQLARGILESLESTGEPDCYWPTVRQVFGVGGPPADRQ